MRQFRIFLIGIPALLALWTLIGMWKDGGEIKRRREDGIAPWARTSASACRNWPPWATGIRPPGARRRVCPCMARARARLRPKPVATTVWATKPDRGRVRVRLAHVARARIRRAAPRALPPDWRLVVRPRTRDAPLLV